MAINDNLVETPYEFNPENLDRMQIVLSNFYKSQLNQPRLLRKRSVKKIQEEEELVDDQANEIDESEDNENSDYEMEEKDGSDDIDESDDIDDDEQSVGEHIVPLTDAEAQQEFVKFINRLRTTKRCRTSFYTIASRLNDKQQEPFIKVLLVRLFKIETAPHFNEEQKAARIALWEKLHKENPVLARSGKKVKVFQNKLRTILNGYEAEMRRAAKPINSAETFEPEHWNEELKAYKFDYKLKRTKSRISASVSHYTYSSVRTREDLDLYTTEDDSEFKGEELILDCNIHQAVCPGSVRIFKHNNEKYIQHLNPHMYHHN